MMLLFCAGFGRKSSVAVKRQVCLDMLLLQLLGSACCERYCWNTKVGGSTKPVGMPNSLANVPEKLREAETMLYSGYEN
jgi:hypothetical protein